MDEGVIGEEESAASLLSFIDISSIDGVGAGLGLFELTYAEML